MALPQYCLPCRIPPFDLAHIANSRIYIPLQNWHFQRHRSVSMILYAYPSLVLWNLFVTYWLMMATVAGGIAAILANALIMMIPLILAKKLFQSSINPIAGMLFLLLHFWVSYEFLHHNWDLAWPWLTLGNGMVKPDRSQFSISLSQEFTPSLSGSQQPQPCSFSIWKREPKTCSIQPLSSFSSSRSFP
jgi:apolipoprotein N-acyltransferase